MNYPLLLRRSEIPEHYVTTNKSVSTQIGKGNLTVAGTFDGAPLYATDELDLLYERRRKRY